MGDDIPVSEKHGINPSMEVCPNCGEETGNILILGRTNRHTCSCGYKVYGKMPNMCPECMRGGGGSWWKTEYDVEAPRHIVGNLCAKCTKEKEEQQLEVAKGGVYFKCKCGVKGIIKAESPMAKHIREMSGVAAPDPVGGEFEECPICIAKKGGHCEAVVENPNPV